MGTIVLISRCVCFFPQYSSDSQYFAKVKVSSVFLSL